MTVRAAGLALVLPDNAALFLRRAPTADHPGTWCFPGGNMEGDERPLDTAIRETREEVAWIQPEDDTVKPKLVPGGNGYATFKKRINSAFIPTLDAENVAYAWCKLDDPPQPIHPELAKMLPAIAMDQELSMSTSANAGVPLWKKGEQEGWTSDMTPEEWKGLVGGLLEFFAEEAQEPEHAAEDDLTEKETAEGQLSERQKSAIGTVGSEKREEMPSHVFLEPGSRKYPVKEKQDGEWKYTRKLLLAAARRARMNGNESLAKRADAIRVREFGSAEDEDDIDIGATDSALVLAMDKESVREFDQDGRMHVLEANICRACVSPYKGSEIPDPDGSLNLDPNKIYKLLRPGDEIEKAASTANGIQILRKHIPVDAGDHKPYDVVGTTGSEARFEYPFLKNSLHFWVKDAIDDIESEDKKSLSPGYHYVCDMTPGTFVDENGKKEDYQGIMRSLRFNHLASVSDGRQPGVVVGDSADEIYWTALENALLEVRAA